MTEIVTPGPDDGTTEGEGQNWRDQFLAGSDLYENPSLATITDIPTLAKSFVETKGMVGRKGVILPKEDDEADVQRFHREMGVPETPEAYEFAKPEQLPEGYAYPEEQIGRFRAIAHKSGLNPKQFNEIVSAFQGQDMEFYQEIVQGGAAREATVTAALQKHWNQNYAAELALSRKTAQSFIENEGEWDAMALALKNDERLVLLWNRIGKAMGEAPLITGSAGETAGLEEKRKQLMSHPAYMDANHPEHKVIVDQVLTLSEQIWPEPKEK